MSSRKKIERITDALDDVPIEDAKKTVDRLGIDVKSMAAGIRAKVAAAEAAAKAQRISEARDAYAREIERLERRKHEPKRTREEQMVVFQALLKRAPEAAMHFHKYESASDEELDELIRSLRHLLGDDDADG